MPTYLPISQLPASTGASKVVSTTAGGSAQLAAAADLRTLLAISAFAATLLDDTTANAARTTLSAQLADNTLDALAAYNTAGLITQTATDTFTGRTITGTANQITVTNGNGVSGNPTLSLDATLAALAALTITAGSFIRGTGADAFAVQSILGTVSQSGGIPTGALIERGSNANGEYVRYADGTQICTYTDATGLPAATADGSLFRSASDGTWTYPIAFVAAPVVTGGPLVSATNRIGIIGNPSTTTCTYNNYRTASSAGTVPFGLMAVGRWF